MHPRVQRAWSLGREWSSRARGVDGASSGTYVPLWSKCSSTSSTTSQPEQPLCLSAVAVAGLIILLPGLGLPVIMWA